MAASKAVEATLLSALAARCPAVDLSQLVASVQVLSDAASLHAIGDVDLEEDGGLGSALIVALRHAELNVARVGLRAFGRLCRDFAAAVLEFLKFEAFLPDLLTHVADLGLATDVAKGLVSLMEHVHRERSEQPDAWKTLNHAQGPAVATALLRQHAADPALAKLCCRFFQIFAVLNQQSCFCAGDALVAVLKHHVGDPDLLDLATWLLCMMTQRRGDKEPNMTTEQWNNLVAAGAHVAAVDIMRHNVGSSRILNFAGRMLVALLRERASAITDALVDAGAANVFAHVLRVWPYASSHVELDESAGDAGRFAEMALTMLCCKAAPAQRHKLAAAVAPLSKQLHDACAGAWSSIVDDCTKALVAIAADPRTHAAFDAADTLTPLLGIISFNPGPDYDYDCCDGKDVRNALKLLRSLFASDRGRAWSWLPKTINALRDGVMEIVQYDFGEGRSAYYTEEGMCHAGREACAFMAWLMQTYKDARWSECIDLVTELLGYEKPLLAGYAAAAAVTMLHMYLVRRNIREKQPKAASRAFHGVGPALAAALAHEDATDADRVTFADALRRLVQFPVDGNKEYCVHDDEFGWLCAVTYGGSVWARRAVKVVVHVLQAATAKADVAASMLSCLSALAASSALWPPALGQEAAEAAAAVLGFHLADKSVCKAAAQFVAALVPSGLPADPATDGRLGALLVTALQRHVEGAELVEALTKALARVTAASNDGSLMCVGGSAAAAAARGVVEAALKLHESSPAVVSHGSLLLCLLACCGSEAGIAGPGAGAGAVVGATYVGPTAGDACSLPSLSFRLLTLPRADHTQPANAIAQWAASHGDAARLRGLAFPGTKKSVDWHAALRMAAAAGHGEVVDLLLKMMPPDDAVDRVDAVHTALACSVSRGNTALAQGLLDRWKANPVVNGRDLLWLALELGQFDMLDLLLTSAGMAAAGGATALIRLPRAPHTLAEVEVLLQHASKEHEAIADDSSGGGLAGVMHVDAAVATAAVPAGSGPGRTPPGCEPSSDKWAGKEAGAGAGASASSPASALQRHRVCRASVISRLLLDTGRYGDGDVAAAANPSLAALPGPAAVLATPAPPVRGRPALAAAALLEAAAVHGHTAILTALLADPRVDPIIYCSGRFARKPVLPLASKRLLMLQPAVLRALVLQPQAAGGAAPAAKPVKMKEPDVAAMCAAAWRRRRAAVLAWLSDVEL